MKRIGFILLLIVCLIFASSCEKDNTHTHDFSFSWNTDESSHWRSCLGEGCTARAAEAEHSFGEAVSEGDGNYKYKCSVCGFEKTTHEHQLSEKHSSDGDYHWFECLFNGCDHKGEKAVHIVVFAIFAIYALSLLFPLVWLFVQSLFEKSELVLTQLREGPFALPKKLYFKNYIEALSVMEVDEVNLIFFLATKI